MNKNIDLQDLHRLPVDWEEIMEVLKTRVQNNLPNHWSDFLASNFGVEILEAVAYEASLMFYYNNASINECFLPTARTRESVYNIAKTLGYKPKPATQSTVKLRFYIDTPNNIDIQIPYHTICTSDNGINFYTTKNEILYAGDTYVDVEAKSGSIHNDKYISNGIATHKYKTLNKNVNKILNVTVDDLEYKELDFIDIQNDKGLYYMVKYDSDYFGYISFGDGVYGVNPNRNSIINVEYVSDANSQDNVAPNTITKINNIIYDVNNSIVRNIKVVNMDYAKGASNPEDLDDIKRNAPSIYKTQNRCVTLSDYEDLLLCYNGVKKVKAIDNSMLDEIGIYGVKLCIIPDTNEIKNEPSYANDLLKKNILDYIDEKKIVSNQVEVIDPTYVKFNVNVDVKILPSVSSEIIISQIKHNISEYLKWNNRNFGEGISKQDIYSLISDINGIIQINNIDISEKRNIYIIETPVENSNKIKVADFMNILTVGSNIDIMDINGKLALSAKISNIEDNILSLVDIQTGENSIIVDSMNIGTGSEIYPVLYTKTKIPFGTKKIYIKNNSITDSLISKRNIVLQDVNYSTIYFNNDVNNIYQILFRIGDVFYLDKPLKNDVEKDSKITILYKKTIPVLDSTAFIYSDTLNLKSYPRFGVGSYLIKHQSIGHRNYTISMYRSESGIDYINKFVNMDKFVKINRIYLNANVVFKENFDYVLENNGTVIKWLDIGKAKLNINETYFVDITTLETTDYEDKYYVTGIKNKMIKISPTLKTTFYDGTVFDYHADSYNLLDWEIADCGDITVEVSI